MSSQTERQTNRMVECNRVGSGGGVDIGQCRKQPKTRIAKLLSSALVCTK